MRIRIHFAGIFFFLLLVAGYAGLSSLQLGYYVNDKVLHFTTFLVLTVVFYWVLDMNRRRTLNLTLTVCTGVLGVGSEFVQGMLPNGREFDVYDIVANIIGSLIGVALCSWYHKRMLERKRRGRGYSTDGASDEQADALVNNVDIELGVGVSGAEVVSQETGVISADSATSGTMPKTLEERVDDWDDNETDEWDDSSMEEADLTSGAGRESNAQPEAKKRME